MRIAHFLFVFCEGCQEWCVDIDATNKWVFVWSGTFIGMGFIVCCRQDLQQGLHVSPLLRSPLQALYKSAEACSSVLKLGKQANGPILRKDKKNRYLRWTEVVQNLCNINLTQNNGAGEWMKGHWCKVHYRLSMNQLRLSVLLWKSSQRKRLLWPFIRLKMENKDVFGELRMRGKTTMCNLICI